MPLTDVDGVGCSVSKKSLLQDQWLVRLVLIVWVLTSAFTLFLFSNIDRIVHHDLYAYGLQFSVTWADRYWGIAFAIYVCMIVPVVLSVGILGYDVVRNRNGKNRNGSARAKRERSKLVTCSKCKKRVNKALVILDFTQKPPKRIRVCPYCHTVLDSTEEKDSETIHIAEYQKVTPSTA